MFIGLAILILNNSLWLLFLVKHLICDIKLTFVLKYFWRQIENRKWTLGLYSVLSFMRSSELLYLHYKKNKQEKKHKGKKPMLNCKFLGHKRGLSCHFEAILIFYWRMFLYKDIGKLQLSELKYMELFTTKWL